MFVGLAACSTSHAAGYGLKEPYEAYRSQQYSNDAMWLCRPGLEHNYCRDNLTATKVAPDGSQRVIPHKVAKRPAFDCFYVYPTVDLSSVPGNHTDFSTIKNERDPLLNQAARFNQLCEVYAPLYPQVTIGSFAAPNSLSCWTSRTATCATPSSTTWRTTTAASRRAHRVNASRASASRYTAPTCG